MATSLRGQLGVRSSALSPTSSKLTTQMLVISHMDNHYKKISKAKSAVDNAPPKSVTLSQKLRDHEVRRRLQKYGSRPASRATCQAEPTSNIYDEKQGDELEDEEMRQMQNIMHTTLHVSSKEQYDADSINAISGRKLRSAGLGTTVLGSRSATTQGTMQTMLGASYRNESRPLSVRSSPSISSGFSQVPRSVNPLRATYDGDVLNKHSYSFTEPSKPFTPRTLKSNRESSLKRYKYYTPPLKKTQSNHKDKFIANGDVKVNEFPHSMTYPKPSRNGTDLRTTETLTETMLMDMSLQSHNPRQQRDGSGVPRLDISMDKDHLNWIQAQGTQAHMRTLNDTSSQTLETRGLGDDNTTQWVRMQEDTDILRFTRFSSPAKSSVGLKFSTSRRLGHVDEEQKYVAFAHDVTQDIVSRGISSDRILQKVFENHIERKQGELDERRLRAIIADIRRDLGMQNVQPLETPVIQHNEEFEETEKIQNDMRWEGAALPDTSPSVPSNTNNIDETIDILNSEDCRSNVDGAALPYTSQSALSNTNHIDETVGILDSEDCKSKVESFTAAATMEYQSDVLNRDSAEEQNSVVSDGVDQKVKTVLGASVYSANLEDIGQESVDGSQHAPIKDGARPAVRPRRLIRQEASIVRQNDASCQDTETNTDIDDEEVEEDYEDDYDADEDDQERGSDDDF